MFKISRNFSRAKFFVSKFFWKSHEQIFRERLTKNLLVRFSAREQNFAHEFAHVSKLWRHFSKFSFKKICMKFFGWRCFFRMNETFVSGFSWLSWIILSVLDLLVPESWLVACIIPLFCYKSFPKIIVANDGNGCWNIGTVLYKISHMELVMSNWLELPKIFICFLCFLDTFKHGVEPSTSATSRPDFWC